jgi:hypothetical protein
MASTPITQAPVTMVADTCDRCGRMFPRMELSESEHTFCEPCRDALWREERGLEPRDIASI